MMIHNVFLFLVIVIGMDQEIKRLEAELATAKQREAELTSNQADAMAKYNSGMAGIELLQEELASAEKKLLEKDNIRKSVEQGLQKKITEAKFHASECEKLRHDLSSMSKIIAEKEGKDSLFIYMHPYIRTYTSVYALMHLRINLHLDEHGDMINALKDKDKELEQLRDLIKQIQSDLLIEEMKQKDANDSLNVLEKEMNATRTALDKARAETNQLSTDLSSLQGKYNNQVEDLEKAHIHINTLQGNLDKTNSETATLNASVARLQEKCDSQAYELNESQAAMDNHKKLLDEMKHTVGEYIYMCMHICMFVQILSSSHLS